MKPTAVLLAIIFVLLAPPVSAHHATPTPYPLPVSKVTFAPVAPLPGQQVSFDGTTSECPIKPCWYQWKVDNQVVSDGLPQTLTRSFTAGAHTVSLEVLDHWWGSSIDTETVTVTAPPPAPVELARGKPVTASSSYPGFPAANANDGNASTRWSSQFAASGEWWRVDLGTTAAINYVEVDWENATASPYQIQTSTDGSTWTTVATQTIPIDVTAVSTTFRTTLPSPVTGRYVRILQGGRGPGNCCYGMSFWEARVYGNFGAPPPPPPPPPASGTEGDIRPSGVFDSGADGWMLSAVMGDPLMRAFFRHFERARVYQDDNWPAVQAYAMNNTSPPGDNSWMPKGWTYRDAMALYSPASDPAFHLRDQAGNPLYINYDCSGGSCTQWAADVGNPNFRAWYVNGLRVHAAESQGVFMDDTNFYMPQVVSNGNGTFVRPWNPRTNALMTDAEWAGYMLQLVKDVKAAFPDPIEVVLNTIAWHGPGLLNIPEAKAAFAVADGWEIEGVTIGNDVAAYQNIVDYVHSTGGFVIHEVGGWDVNYLAAIYLCFNAGNDYIGHSSMNPNQAWPALWDRNLGNATGPCVKGADGIFRRTFVGGNVTADPAKKTGTIG